MTSLADKIQKRRQQAGIAPAQPSVSHKKQTHSLPVNDRIEKVVDQIMRSDFNPIELAEELDSILIDGKLTQVQLAKKIRVTQGWISKTLSLLTATSDVQEKIRRGELAATAYYNTTAESVKKITISRSQAVAIAKLFGEIAIKHGLNIELSKKPTKTEILAALARVKDIKRVVLK